MRSERLDITVQSIELQNGLKLVLPALSAKPVEENFTVLYQFIQREVILINIFLAVSKSPGAPVYLRI